MRTKTLLLTAALGAVGVATSMAQVFSENAVGYYVKDLPQGFSLIANQLNNGDNNLNTILPLDDSLVGSEILKWDSGTQTFAATEAFFGSGLGGWLDPVTFAPTATTLNPGEGAFINMFAAGSLTFVGEVPQGNLSVTIPPFFSILSQPTPQALGIASTADASGPDDLPASSSDEVLFWDNQAQGFEATIANFGAANGGFLDPVLFTPVNPTPEVGEAFFYNSAAANDVDWTRTFTVN